jgi:hypothetical protein
VQNRDGNCNRVHTTPIRDLDVDDKTDGEGEEAADREDEADGRSHGADDRGKSVTYIGKGREEQQQRQARTEQRAERMWEPSVGGQNVHDGTIVQPHAVKELKVERHGEKPQESRWGRTRNTFPKTV